MSGRSPLPWVIRPNRFDDWGWIRGADGDTACMARWSPDLTEDDLNVHRSNKTDPAQANADLIVKAVNSYDALKHALEVCSGMLAATTGERSSFKFTGDWSRLGTMTVGQALDLAEAALAVPSAGTSVEKGGVGQ